MAKRPVTQEVITAEVEGKENKTPPPPNHHPYAFHVSGPRKVSSPNWRDLISSSWKDGNYRRTVIACFIQAVYLLELDRQENKTEADALAPKILELASSGLLVGIHLEDMHCHPSILVVLYQMAMFGFVGAVSFCVVGYERIATSSCYSESRA